MIIPTKIYFPSGDEIRVNLDSDIKLTKNFTVYEIANKRATDLVKLELYPHSLNFLIMFQELRDWYGKPMTVNSGYRTKKYNATLPDADPRSAHLQTCAIDIPLKLTDAGYKRHKDKWKEICNKYHVVGAINFYKWGIHYEAYSDIFYGNKRFVVRDKR